LRPIDILTGETAVEVTGVVEVSPALWYFKSSEHIVDYTSHGVGSNQFLLVNIRIIQFVSFGYYNDQIKENCRITMEFSDKVDSIKYSTAP
jgi:hypothetical protein